MSPSQAKPFNGSCYCTERRQPKTVELTSGSPDAARRIDLLLLKIISVPLHICQVVANECPLAHIPGGERRPVSVFQGTVILGIGDKIKMSAKNPAHRAAQHGRLTSGISVGKKFSILREGPNTRPLFGSTRVLSRDKNVSDGRSAKARVLAVSCGFCETSRYVNSRLLENRRSGMWDNWL